MRTIIAAGIAAGLVTACGSGGDAPKPKQAKADALQAGEYEITAKVDSIRSTDGTTPDTRSAATEPPKVTRICVPADGTIDHAAFAEGEEKCTAADSYMHRGRLSVQLRCNRDGKGLTHMVDGEFTADGFTGKVLTATYFAGTGDYELARTLTGKRLGDCPAAAPAEAP